VPPQPENPPGPEHSQAPPALGAAIVAKTLAGLLISGLLMALPGAVLPYWRHHIDSRYLLIGAYFLAQVAGLLGTRLWAPRLMRAQGLGVALSVACWLAAGGLVVMGVFIPEAHWGWRIGGLLMTGSAAGLMNLVVFAATTGAYARQPAATINLAGAFYGSGSLVCALAVGASYSFRHTGMAMGILLLLLPAAGCVLYLRARIPDQPPRVRTSWQEVAREFRSPAAILLALLLFFQFGNEGAIGGWLALFLTQKIGMSPAKAVFLLALYFAALLVGRIPAQMLLPSVRHGRLLLGSVLMGLFGSLMLAFTTNSFGAVTGVLLCGGAFSMILPLAFERIGARFPHFHPGFASGVFAIALAGGLLAPASLGLYADWFGIDVVMVLPMVGSIMVLLLVLLIFLEARMHAAATAARG
jgi:FHS family glucose/mannose:H+ symporter-like MFS transporter